MTLIDVWQENVDKLNNDCAKVVGTTTLTTPVKASTPDGTLVSLQNGLPEKYILTQLPAKNVVSGAVEFGASAQGPAISELTTEYGAFKDFAFKIGEIDGSDTERIHKLKNIMDNVGDTHISDNLMGTKWTKLLVNASFSGLSAASNATFGDVANSDVGILGAFNIMNEGLLAGQADSITFDKMGPLDPTLFLKNGEFTDQQIDTLRKVIASSAGLKASMMQDLEKRRKTEISDINGVVATVGKEHGIPTPFNDFIIQSVKHSEESGTLPNFDTTMTELEKVLNANG